ncbi:uncharacterized membrane protein At1g16860-like [Phoenix dactylifera]|uniref:Uncharacterized membrane protein At1g16860-like n=1 Tax=Phoenix dactylifera TaxID=42345 RepID=A0A8B8ZKZ6_PHODC|nr:uncharacterized membrane protein At1g16860-like [Phoenix dactylifera]
MATRGDRTPAIRPLGPHVPHDRVPRRAKLAVSFCRFPPRGVRGFADTVVRASAYGIDDGYLARVDEELLVMCQVGMAAGLAEIEVIAGIEGVDVVQMEPLDLSASMGHLWDLRDAMKEAERKLGRNRFHPGATFLHDPCSCNQQTYCSIFCLLGSRGAFNLIRWIPALFIWNTCCGRKAIIEFKITRVVACTSASLVSSFQKVPRCVCTSASLYEYRGWHSRAANPQHRCFSWGLRSVERHVVEFQITDPYSGLRVLVMTGNNSEVTQLVDDSIVVDIERNDQDLPPDLIRWLEERNISRDDRVMRMKEGCIKEGTASKPVFTGFQWTKFILPARLEGIPFRYEDTKKSNVVVV